MVEQSVALTRLFQEGARRGAYVALPVAMHGQQRLKINNLFALHCAGGVVRYRSFSAEGGQDDTDAQDLEPFEDNSAREDELQDIDDTDPLAPQKPAFDPSAFDGDSPEEGEK